MIIISPAKNLNILPETHSFKLSEPFFNNDTNSLVRKLKKLKFSNLKNLMNISDSLTELNLQRLKDFDSHNNVCKPAVFLFSGDTFNGLSIRSFSKEMLSFAQDRLRILSGLYGLLRPLDLIQPYRLEMGTKLAFDSNKNLYDYWRKKITEQLNLELYDNEPILNLASNEYFKAIDSKVIKSDVYTANFKQFKNGEFKTIAIFSKKARGMMTRFIIDNNISEMTEIKAFDYDGYMFHEKLSTEKELIFTR